jgi:hypothetical protein
MAVFTVDDSKSNGLRNTVTDHNRDHISKCHHSINSKDLDDATPIADCKVIGSCFRGQAGDLG